MLSYNSSNPLNQPTNGSHYSNTYDFASQYNPSPLDTSSFSYANSPLVAAAAAAAAASNVNNQSNVANYLAQPYAALAQHALAGYQQ